MESERALDSFAGPIFLRRTGVHFGRTRVRCAEHALVGQEAFLVDAWERIAKYVVAARKTARRASTVSERAFSTVMDHRSGRSATKASLGGAMLPLGMGRWRPSQNCGRDHRSCRKVFHRYFPFTRMTVGYPRDNRTNNRGSPGHWQTHANAMHHNVT
jgi:hypothetical protein